MRPPAQHTFASGANVVFFVTYSGASGKSFPMSSLVVSGTLCGVMTTLPHFPSAVVQLVGQIAGLRLWVKSNVASHFMAKPLQNVRVPPSLAFLFVNLVFGCFFLNLLTPCLRQLYVQLFAPTMSETPQAV